MKKYKLKWTDLLGAVGMAAIIRILWVEGGGFAIEERVALGIACVFIAISIISNIKEMIKNKKKSKPS